MKSCDCGCRFDRPGWVWRKTSFVEQYNPPRFEKGKEIGNPIVKGCCPGCAKWVEMPTYGGALEEAKRNKQKNDKRLVYVVGPVEGFYKIGLSGDVGRRVLELQTALPVDLSCICSFPGGEVLEKKLHRKFWDKKVRGEWFALSPEDLDELKGMS